LNDDTLSGVKKLPEGGLIVSALKASHVLDVASRREGPAGAGDDDDAAGGVRLQRPQRLQQILAHRLRKRVELFGPIQRDRGDGIFDPRFDKRHFAIRLKTG
jgi:hypothetical protein